MPDALAVFRAMADPTRLRIVALVRRVELSVGELAAVLGQSQPRVSRHVKILAAARLVRRHKEGAWVFLTLGEAEHLAPLAAALDRWGIDPALLAADTAQLVRMRTERQAAAQAWFAANAAQWDRLRALHTPEAEVEAAIVATLGERAIGRLLDIGTGTGRMLELLGPAARTATGIDRSPEMLRLARTKLDAIGLAQAEVRQADMAALPLTPASADTVVLHQVLHFADDPAAVIAEAARVLAPGGRLLVADFAPHAEEELRVSHAHARLGFTDEAIAGWLAAAGLTAVSTRHLTGGRLTVAIWLAERVPLRLAEAA